MQVVMLPEEPEDLWHAYNLVCAGDRVTTTTYRKVIKEGSTGSVSAQRVRTNITLEVLSVDFNAQDCNVRISGRNVEENEYVKVSKLVWHAWLCLLYSILGLHLSICLSVYLVMGIEEPRTYVGMKQQAHQVVPLGLESISATQGSMQTQPNPIDFIAPLLIISNPRTNPCKYVFGVWCVFSRWVRITLWNLRCSASSRFTKTVGIRSSWSD
jgi:hypothetical protein